MQWCFDHIIGSWVPSEVAQHLACEHDFARSLSLNHAFFNHEVLSFKKFRSRILLMMDVRPMLIYA